MLTSGRDIFGWLQTSHHSCCCDSFWNQCHCLLSVAEIVIFVMRKVLFKLFILKFAAMTSLMCVPWTSNTPHTNSILSFNWSPNLTCWYLNQAGAWQPVIWKQLSPNMASQLENDHCCIKHWWSVYEQNSIMLMQIIGQMIGWKLSLGSSKEYIYDEW